MKNNFLWLQILYSTHFRDLYHYDFSIETLDNPGWAFFAKLKGTQLEKKEFADIEYSPKKNNWLMCRVREGKFESACSPTNLSRVLGIFQKWVEENSLNLVNESPEDIQDRDILLWLQNWYYSFCNGDWEHDWRVRIETCDSPGWRIRINCIDTDLKGKSFESVQIHEKDQWLICGYEDSVFTASCSPKNLSKAITTFRTWVEGT